MMVVFSVADMVNIALKTWVFTKADSDMYSYPVVPACETKALPADAKASSTDSQAQCEKDQAANLKQQQDSQIAQKQRDIVRDLSMIVVGIPLFAYHWRIIRRKE